MSQISLVDRSSYLNTQQKHPHLLQLIQFCMLYVEITETKKWNIYKYFQKLFSK